MYKGFSDSSTSKLVSSSLLSVWKESSKSLVTSSTVYIGHRTISGGLCIRKSRCLRFVRPRNAAAVYRSSAGPVGGSPVFIHAPYTDACACTVRENPTLWLCQRSLFVTIVGRDSSAAKRHRLEAG